MKGNELWPLKRKKKKNTFPSTLQVVVCHEHAVPPSEGRPVITASWLSFRLSGLKVLQQNLVDMVF